MANSILIGTTDGLYRSKKLDSPLLPCHEVRSLALHGDTWWAVIDQREVWRGDANGQWEKVAVLEEHPLICVYPTGSDVWIGVSGPHLYRLKRKKLELVESFENVEGSEDWFSPPGPINVRSMAHDDKDKLYVNVHVGGIPCSADAGKTWKPTIDIDSDVHQVIWDDRHGCLWAACAVGLAKSTDRGKTWKYINKGLHADYCRAVAVSNDTVFLTASTGPATSKGAIYRMPVNGDRPLEKCHNGLPEWFGGNINTFQLASNEDLVAFGSPEGILCASEDRGDRWNRVAEHLPNILCVAIHS